MGTTPDDQEKVLALGSERGWKAGSVSDGVQAGVKVVSCFGKLFSILYTSTVDFTSWTLGPTLSAEDSD
jgi:hypothetical protein